MIEVWVEWFNKKKEKIDSAEQEVEALYLVSNYQKSFGDKAKKIWIQESPVRSINFSYEED